MTDADWKAEIQNLKTLGVPIAAGDVLKLTLAGAEWSHEVTAADLN